MMSVSVDPPVRRRVDIKFTHRPALDGLRAVAAMLVTLFHAGVPFLTGGFVGVDVFFVLSGFLITSLLLREVHVKHRLDFVAFYARRARRLLPAAALVLIVTAIGFQFLASPLQVALDRGGFIAAALYVSNWYFLSQSQDYFAADQAPSPVLHYWSLSVEEQFYIVWPALLLAIVLMARYRSHRLTWIVGTLAVVAFGYSALVNVDEPMLSYFGTVARAYQLLVGALVAIWLFRREVSPGQGARLASAQPHLMWLAPLGLAAIVVASTSLVRDSGPLMLGLISSLGTAALLVGLETSPRQWLGRVLSHPVPRRIGRYSYSIYLWHWPVIVLAGLAGVLPSPWPVRAIFVVALSIGLADLTWRFVERPISNIRLDRIKVRRRMALLGPLGALTTVALLLILLPVSARTHSLIASADINRNEGSHEVQTVGEPNGGAPNVMLVGDSHAGYWEGPLAEAAQSNEWQFTVVRENGCPWPDVTSLADGGREMDCVTQLHDAALRTAAEVKPDVVILASHSVLERPISVAGSEAFPGSDSWLAEEDRGSREFIGELMKYAGRVVILQPTPQTSTAMVDCLSSTDDATTCDLPAEATPGLAEIRKAWTRLASDTPHVSVIDLTDLICPNGECQAMTDGVITFRDDNHLTEEFATRLVPDLLQRAGISVPTS